MEVKERFPIIPSSGSVRLFFARESELSTIWHICDAALGFAEAGGHVRFMALHGAKIYAKVRCDTVLQAKLQTKVSDSFCARCLEEFELARPEIEEKRLLKFK